MTLVESVLPIVDLKPLLQSAPMEGVRFSEKKISRADFLRLAPFELEPSPYYSNGFRFTSPYAGKGKHPLHLSGACYFQEPSAMSAITALDVRESDRVLDLCAAPGSKATALGEKCPRGFLVANEIHPARAKILLSNVERMGLANTVVTHATPVELSAKLEGVFDKILVDSPCSGEGMFRKEPEVLTQWSEELVQMCAKRSAEILDEAAKMLRPGGRMVYSTCTFNTLENEQTILSFLERHPDFYVVESGIPAAGEGLMGLSKAARFYPDGSGEGHFVCAMQRAGDEIDTDYPRYPDKKMSADFAACIEQCIVDLPALFGGRSPVAIEQKDCLWLVSPDLPRLDGIHLLRAGVMAATRRGKICLPCHHLFTASPLQSIKMKETVDTDRALAFLRGEEIDGAGKGFTAVVWENLVLGFGKASGGKIKNHYPKGLRI